MNIFNSLNNEPMKSLGGLSSKQICEEAENVRKKQLALAQEHFSFMAHAQQEMKTNSEEDIAESARKTASLFTRKDKEIGSMIQKLDDLNSALYYKLS